MNSFIYRKAISLNHVKEY